MHSPRLKPTAPEVEQSHISSKSSARGRSGRTPRVLVHVSGIVAQTKVAGCARPTRGLLSNTASAAQNRNVKKWSSDARGCEWTRGIAGHAQSTKSVAYSIAHVPLPLETFTERLFCAQRTPSVTVTSRVNDDERDK